MTPEDIAQITTIVAASEERTNLRIEASEQRTNASIEASEQRTNASIEASEQRTNARIEASEERTNLRIEASQQRTNAAIEAAEQRTIESMRDMQTEILKGLEAFARGNFARLHRLETSDTDTAERLAALEQRVLMLEVRRPPL